MNTDLDAPATGDAPLKTSTIEILEEAAVISTRTNVTGRVRVATRTETFEETVEQALETVDAKITRVPVDRYLDPDEALPKPRIEGVLTIIPVLEEVLVVEKRILLREEVHIELKSTIEQVAVPVTLRKQQADIERLPEPLPANLNSQTHRQD